MKIIIEEYKEKAEKVLFGWYLHKILYIPHK